MITRRHKRLSWGILSAFLVAALAGCVSVEKRYKKGQELESKGRLEEAAQRYITVLGKDPGMEEARQSLADVGSRLVDDYLAQAGAHGSSGDYESAVAVIARLDSLRNRAGQVGVALAVPEDYAEFRREMIDAAVASLFRQAGDLESAGNWAQAVRRYDLMRSYPLAPEQMQSVDEARARALIRWAEQDMERGAFRAAYGHAQAAIDVFGPDSEAGAQGLILQNAALDAGTKTVAVLPFWTSPGAGDTAPRGMEGELYDILLYEYMAAPVLFLGPIDRGEIHREMSRLRIRSGEIPSQTALLVGLGLNADFVVTGWLESYTQEDGVAQETARRAPLRRDRSSFAEYTEKSYTVKLTGELRIRIFEVASRRAVDEERVVASASGRFRRASFDGDYTTLDLSRDERALFDKEARLRAEEELQAALCKKLAEKAAASIIDRVLRYVR